MTADSPTQRVGGKPKEGFAKMAHSRPMLSLDNAYNEAELRAWEQRVREALPASSGAVCVRAEAGWVVAGAEYGAGSGRRVRARAAMGGAAGAGGDAGDGSIGEDVTTNVRTIRSVPLSMSAEKLGGGGAAEL